MKQRKPILTIYNENVDWYASKRNPALMEKNYLDFVISHIPQNGTVLDVGCGIGKPIAAYFLSNGFTVTGVDGAPNMIAKAKELNPSSTWMVADMRSLNLNLKFDAVIAWDSFFHLTQDEQRNMFSIFKNHLNPKGVLVFTSGPDAGEAIGEFNGNELYHSSLSIAEYQSLLTENNFIVLKHEVEDPTCGGHTVWVAQQK